MVQDAGPPATYLQPTFDRARPPARITDQDRRRARAASTADAAAIAAIDIAAAAPTCLGDGAGAAAAAAIAAAVAAAIAATAAAIAAAAPPPLRGAVARCPQQRLHEPYPIALPRPRELSDPPLAHR